MALDLAGIAASAGSACTAGSIDPSPVLLALGVDDWRVNGALRFSLGPGQADGRSLGERVVAAIRGVIRA
jgi:cysteine desulfurase